MNANMKAITLAAIMIVAAVSMVSLYTDDTDGASDIQFVDDSVSITEETNPFGGSLISLNFTFNKAPAEGKYAISIIDTASGDVIEADEIQADGKNVQFACQIDKAYDIKTITIVANIDGENIQWPAATPEPEPTTYTVTFMVDGVEYYVLTVEENGAIVVPEVPAKEGFTFQYWSLSENGAEYDITAPVTDNITLYAVYKQNTVEPEPEIMNAQAPASSAAARRES